MTQHEKDTRPDVQVAFLIQHDQLQQAAFEQWPELTFDEAERIMGALAANLYRYRRPAGDGFTRWAVAWVRRQTRRHRFLTELFREYPGLLYAAIDRSLFCSQAQDAAIEPCDNEADIYLHLLRNPRKLDALMKPKSAKVSTMLFGLAKSRMRAFREQINSRRAAVVKRLNTSGAIQCEHLTSPEEISEMAGVA